MALRFRRSVKILPGLKLNIGKSGINSVTIGKRGASVTAGKKGVYGNVGAPGTGISYRSKLSGDAPRQKTGKAPENHIKLSDPHGAVIFGSCLVCMFIGATLFDVGSLWFVIILFLSAFAGVIVGFIVLMLYTAIAHRAPSPENSGASIVGEQHQVLNDQRDFTVKCPMCKTNINYTLDQAFRQESFRCSGCGVKVELEKPRRLPPGSPQRPRSTAKYVPNAGVPKPPRVDDSSSDVTSTNQPPSTPAWPVKVDVRPTAESSKYLTVAKEFFDISAMPKWIWPSEAGSKSVMYSLEGTDRELAKKYLASLNSHIAQASHVLSKELGFINPEVIAWKPYSPGNGVFTWLEAMPLTPTGKNPKYEHCLHFMCPFPPYAVSAMSDRPENYIWGDLFFAGKTIGKALVLVWKGRDLTSLHLKIVKNELKLWKIEYGDGQPQNIIKL